ncbi:MAG: hypothetical protein R3E94_15750 [Burkholderiaceae bacterium]
MEQASTPQTAPAVSLPVNMVADVQDSLLMVLTDLQRLVGLLDHATGNLLERFGSAERALGHLEGRENDDIRTIRTQLHQAVTELQFHDMATQLINHTSQILQGCAWRLADETMELEGDEQPLNLDPMPERPSPVTQSEMDSGSIELF